MGFTAKVHRRSRRKLGRGQYLQVDAVVGAPVDVVAKVTITFDRPVVVSGAIDLHLSGAYPLPVLLFQAQISPTVVEQTYDIAVAGCDWALVAGDPAIHTFQGGTVVDATGTF